MAQRGLTDNDTFARTSNRYTEYLYGSSLTLTRACSQNELFDKTLSFSRKPAPKDKPFSSSG